MALTYPVEVPSRRVEADRSVVSKHLVAKPTDCPCSCGCICGCGGRGEKPPSEWSVSSDGVTIIYLGPPHDPREAMTSEQLKRRRRTCDCDGHKTCCGPLEKLICLAVRFVLCVLAVIETPFQVIIARVLLACPHPPPALSECFIGTPLLVCAGDVLRPVPLYVDSTACHVRGDRFIRV